MQLCLYLHDLTRPWCAGIDDDVKLWAPTAEEPQPLPPECAEQMAANRAGRGRRVATNMQQIFLTPGEGVRACHAACVCAARTRPCVAWHNMLMRCLPVTLASP